MDPLENPLSPRPIQSGMRFYIDPYPNSRPRYIENLYNQFWQVLFSAGPGPEAKVQNHY